MRRLLTAVAASLVAVLSLASPAAAEAEDQEFIILFHDDAPGTVIADGPISGVGQDFEDDATETGRFVFPEGTVTVHHPQTEGSEEFDEFTCIATFEGEGTYDITGGTGAYQGVDGSGTYEVEGIFIGERTADGCSEEGGRFFAIVRAEGTTALD